MHKYFDNLDIETLDNFSNYLNFIRETYKIDLNYSFWRLTFHDGSKVNAILLPNINVFNLTQAGFQFYTQAKNGNGKYISTVSVRKIFKDIKFLGSFGEMLTNIWALEK